MNDGNDALWPARGEELRRARAMVGDRRDVLEAKLREAMFATSFEEAKELTKELRHEVYVSMASPPIRAELDFLDRRLKSINDELISIGQSPDPVHPGFVAERGEPIAPAAITPNLRRR